MRTDLTNGEAPATTTVAEAPSSTNPCSILQQSRYRVKRLDALTAAAAQVGISVQQTADGTFTVTRWGLCRELTSVDALGAFLRQMGVRA